MASSTQTEVILVHVNDGERWSQHIQNMSSRTNSVKIIGANLSSWKNTRASIDHVIKGKLVIVLATPNLLDLLMEENKLDFQLAARCILLLCGTEEKDFDYLLTRCFNDPAAVVKLSHEQVKSSLMARLDVLRRDAETDLSFDVIPPTVFCEHSTTVIINFRDVDVSGRSFSVTLNDSEKLIRCICINKHTHLFQAPVAQAGDVIVRLLENDKVIGVDRLTYVDDTSRDSVQQMTLCLLDIQSELLQKTHVNSKNIDEAIDKLFAYDAKDFSSEVFETLFQRFVSGKNQYDEELPSLLHWAAKYGYSKFNSHLLELPNSNLATCVLNRDGFSPADLARKFKHSSIATAIDTIQTKEEWYVDMYFKLRGILTDDDIQVMDSYYNINDDYIYANPSDGLYSSVSYRYWSMKRADPQQEGYYSDTAVLSNPAVTNGKDDIFKLTPEEKEAKSNMAPHLQELVNIIESVKTQEHSQDDAEKLFKSWQDQYMRRSSVVHAPVKNTAPSGIGIKDEKDKKTENDSRPSLLQKMKAVVWRKHIAGNYEKVSALASCASEVLVGFQETTSSSMTAEGTTSSGATEVTPESPAIPPPRPPRRR